MSRRLLVVVVLLCIPAAGVGQQSLPPAGGAYFGSPATEKFTPGTVFGKTFPSLTPPRDGGYFGTPAGDAFTASGVFGPLPAPLNPMAPPEPPPALPPADGGLFPDPPPPPPRKLWSGSLEAGATGATGNSEVLNLRVAAFADRKTDRNLYHADFLYGYGSQDGKTTQNAALFNARDEILFGSSPWTLFGATNIEYDELRKYRFRVGVYTGVGFIVRNTDTTLFKLRAGAGAVRELGGTANGTPSRWVPEGVFGYDFKYKLDVRQSFLSNMDVYPRLDSVRSYRARRRIAYEVVLDPKSGTALRLGAQSRYDSDPGPKVSRLDVNYFVTLVANF